MWSDDMLAIRNKLIRIAKNELDQHATIIVFPESVAGSSRRPQVELWKEVSLSAKSKGAVVLVGEEAWNTRKTGFYNALVGFGDVPVQGQVIAAAQVPMPVGDWKFGLEEGAISHIFGKDVISLAGKFVAVSMCYEDFILWPHRGLLSGKADVLISAANQWPSRGTSAETAQDLSRKLLGRLAGVPMLIAKNH
ncbi:MAG: hypothetical protein HC848_06105 [Limnobacter sp.]|nr:hypothetical protein [Limnobacter sp.]